jgi:hypothetical protein
MRLQEFAERFIKVWPTIVSQARTETPTIYKVQAGRGLKIERAGPARGAKPRPRGDGTSRNREA